MMGEKKHTSNNTNKKERKNNRINLRITDSEADELNFVMYKDEEPLSLVVRKALKMYISARKSTY